MRTRLTLHRGANRVAPENTRAAAEAAIRYGADVLEVDVRASADGTLHNLHDETVDRTTNGTGRFCDLRDDEIAALDAGSWFSPAFASERIPPLDALCTAVAPRIGFFFDVKSCEPHALAALVARHDLAERCYILSEDDGLSRALIAAIPQARHMVQYRAIGSAAAAKAAGYRIIELVPDELDTPHMDEARAAGLEVQVWCAEDAPEVFENMLAFGVDYANVDHPEAYLSVAARSTAQR